jgi:hypothetical protein
MISWGNDFTYSSTPTTARAVGLFNQTACRIDYNYTNGILTFTNATLSNLGVPGYDFLPIESEIKVASIFLTYKI